MSLDLIFALFGAGILMAIVGWVGFGLIPNLVVRALLRTAALALFTTPSLVIGHGAAPAPAYLVMGLPDHFWLGLVPVLGVWLASLAIVLSIRRLRESRTDWPLEWETVLSEPVWVKLPLYGLSLGLLYAGLRYLISEHWWLGVLVLLAGGALNYNLCRSSYRHRGRGLFLLPLLVAAPVALTGMLPFAALWYVSGLAGALVARGQTKTALWLGAATFALLCVTAVRRALLAFEYRDVAHVTIQGGVTFAATSAGVFLALTLLFAFLARRSG